MKRILSLLLLFPLTMNAMENKNVNDITGISLANRHCAEIRDHNKRRLATDDCRVWGPYVVDSTWICDDVTKKATVEYIVKKGETTLLSDTTHVDYETALNRPLENGNSLRLWISAKVNTVFKEIEYQDK